nr:uncharacterized protein LOC112001032 [Quercus suber]
MIDIGFSDARYTWSNNRPLMQLVQERIDRYFVNAEWYAFFPKASDEHLERGHSNHCPVKLHWDKVSKFTNKAKVWNRNVFGNLLHQKKSTLARLRSVQIALSNNPKNFLIHLKQELRTELAKILKLEEEFWAMKLRITWLVERDRNTAFYHTSALERQSRIRINFLKDNMGNWLNEESDIADFIRTGYALLFMSSHSSSLLLLWDPPCWNSCLKEGEVAKLAV